MPFKTDIEIAHAANPLPIGQLAADCGLQDTSELLDHFYAKPERRYWAGRARVVFELAQSGERLVDLGQEGGDVLPLVPDRHDHRESAVEVGRRVAHVGFPFAAPRGGASEAGQLSPEPAALSPRAPIPVRRSLLSPFRSPAPVVHDGRDQNPRGRRAPRAPGDVAPPFPACEDRLR